MKYLTFHQTRKWKQLFSTCGFFGSVSSVPAVDKQLQIVSKESERMRHAKHEQFMNRTCVGSHSVVAVFKRFCIHLNIFNALHKFIRKPFLTIHRIITVDRHFVVILHGITDDVDDDDVMYTRCVWCCVMCR